MAGPLDGIRIIDMTAVVLGPVATLHLADMGADVVKIEPPDGDVMRNAGHSPAAKMGPIFLNANRNKRSIALDLKKPAAVETVKRLVAQADVFVHNNRPAAVERLGLGYDALKAINPRLVYAFAHGYKRTGPYGHMPAYDDLVQAASGAAMLQSRIDGGEPRFLPTLVADKTTGLHLGMAILAALLARERTGVAQEIEVPMLEAVTGFWMLEHLYDHTFVPPRGDMGYARILNEFRRPYRTRDGYVMALPYTAKHWSAFTEGTGRRDLAADPRFATLEARANNQAAAMAAIAEIMRTRSTADWLAFCEENDIPAQRINDLEDLLGDPHLAATGFFTRREHPVVGPVLTMASPFNFSRTPTSFRRHAPTLGGDGREVLAEAGFGAAEIDGLVASGALVDGGPA